MNRTNKRLLAVALLTLGLSAMTHWNVVSRADRFERGQRLLPNLNPDEVSTIEIRANGGSVTLDRDGDRFVIAEENGYRAKNEEVNRVVRDLQAVTLAKRIGTGDALAAELGFGDPDRGVEPDAAPPQVEAVGAAIELALYDAAGAEMVRLELGDPAEDGGGTYLRRIDGEDDTIYVSEAPIQLPDDADHFLDTEILDVPSTELGRVEGADFVLVRGEEGGDLELTEVPAGRSPKSIEVNRAQNLLSRLLFEDVVVADDPEVRELVFEDAFRFELADGSGYTLQTATEGERTFLRVAGFHTVDRVEITMETTEEEMAEKSDTLHRAEEIDRFNAYHGSWVYEVGDATAEKLALDKAALLESA